MARRVKFMAGLAIMALAASPAFAQFGAFGDVLKKAMAGAEATKAPVSEKSITAQGSLLGEWMNEGQSCIAPSDDGEYVEGSNLSIESASIHGFEWGCDLNPAIAEGAASYQGEQSCYGDGADEAPTPIALTLLPDGKLQIEDANGTQTLFRCQ